MIGFVHVNKTGGSTVKFILRNSFGLGHCQVSSLDPEGVCTGGDVRFARRVYFGLKSISGHHLVHPTAHIDEPILYFTFLREPLERCASHYQHVKRARRRKGKDISLEEFLALPRMNNLQVKKIAGGPDLDEAKRELAENYFFVGLVERFAQSVALLGRLCPYKLDLRYVRLHVAKDNTAKREALADPGSRKRLEAANELDRELYAYARDELYPAFLEKGDPGNAKVRVEECERIPFPFRYRLNIIYSRGVYQKLFWLRRFLSR